MKNTISRAEAEKRITEYQLELLAEHSFVSTWELYALLGIGHCCGGAYSRSDTELREIYKDYIPGVEGLKDEELVKAVVDFELSQSKEGKITCQGIGLATRICDGLGKYANEELSWLFPDILKDFEVTD